MRDKLVNGSVECLRELDRLYRLLYLSARPESLWKTTAEWMTAAGFPFGELQTAPTAAEQLAIAREMARQSHIAAGIVDRWDDNELHLEPGCKSIILKEYEGN